MKAPRPSVATPSSHSVNRRTFVKTTATFASLTALSASRVLGANERIRVGLIGFGLIGRIHTRSLLNQPDVDLVAFSDTYQPRLEAAVAMSNGRAKPYRDFRQLLEDKNVDAVFVTTPDHWHALMTMMACAAGKDVYVEKPMTLFIAECQWMTKVARKHNRVVQVGTQNRSGPQFARARQLIRDGKIGQIVSVQCNYFRNAMP